MASVLERDTERQKNLIDYLSGGTCSRCWNFTVVSEALFSISHILLAGLFWLLLLALSSFSVNSVPAMNATGIYHSNACSVARSGARRAVCAEQQLAFTAATERGKCRCGKAHHVTSAGKGNRRGAMDSTIPDIGGQSKQHKLQRERTLLARLI